MFASLSAAARRRRWSDDNKHFGPFTFSRGSLQSFCVVLDSGDDESPGCRLRMGAFGCMLLLELPAIIKPWRQWVCTGQRAWAKGDPNAGYWDVHEREFGFSYSHEDGFLQLFLGPQTGDSSTTKSWACFLPWTQWRHVRQSWYGASGEHVASRWDSSSRETQRAQWDWQREFEASQLPKVDFYVTENDGQVTKVSTFINEREWRFGTKWCSWLSWFRKPRIVRYLNIKLAKEVGPDKGSYKGGLRGTSISMLPGELHESAFKRYCDLVHHAKYGTYRLIYSGMVDQ